MRRVTPGYDERSLDPDAETTLVFLPIDEVCKRVSLSRRTVEMYVESGDFPTPIQLTKRRIAFVESEVHQWMKERIADRDGQSDLRADTKEWKR